MGRTDIRCLMKSVSNELRQCCCAVNLSNVVCDIEVTVPLNEAAVLVQEYCD